MPEPVPKSADAIQGQMAKIRSDLHADVRGIVENARVITDWKYYVRRYPWASVAGAAAAGLPGRSSATGTSTARSGDLGGVGQNESTGGQSTARPQTAWRRDDLAVHVLGQHLGADGRGIHGAKCRQDPACPDGTLILTVLISGQVQTASSRPVDHGTADFAPTRDHDVNAA